MKTCLTAMAMAAALAACATGTGLSDTDRLALYRAHAGEPVKDFQYFNSLNGWTELGDSALAVWTKPSEAYLLELSGSCLDLSYSPAISISNQFGRVAARFDSVRVIGAGPGPHIPCRIQTIRPLDVKAIRASEKELREARVQEREAGATE